MGAETTKENNKMSLHHIYRSKTLEELAASIRQHGMSISPEIQLAYNSRPEHALDVICEYETHARIVLQSDSMSSAWRYLRGAGFGDPPRGLKDPMGLGWEKQGHPDSCGADAANEPEEEFTELEGDTLWSQD
jgi:hypothetical protein